MLENCSLCTRYYKVYGCNGPVVEEYLGTVQGLSDALDLCRTNLVTFSVFSIYSRITDLLGSDVFLGLLDFNDLKF